MIKQSSIPGSAKVATSMANMVTVLNFGFTVATDRDKVRSVFRASGSWAGTIVSVTYERGHIRKVA